jgi:hypothetical protein
MRPVLFRLNNGRTLHLPPRFVSDELNDAQILNNSKVEKLVKKRIIKVVHLGAEKKSTTRGRAKSKPASSAAKE